MANEITIDIEPIPQPRHRVTSIGGRARTYLPTKHPVHQYKRAIAEAVKDWPKYGKGVPLSLELWFWLPMPASWSKRKQAANLWKPHTQKPDIDNLTKAVMDAMSGCWHDDCQVADLTVRKRWCTSGEGGRVLISLEAMKDDD
jgi:Holliday junction resolvase RusA-like endonuclease